MAVLLQRVFHWQRLCLKDHHSQKHYLATALAGFLQIIPSPLFHPVNGKFTPPL